MSESSPQSSLAIKLVAAFLIAMGLIGFAAWYAYSNFNKLLGSVETLSTPDQSTDLLQGLLNAMHSADNDMRNYIMSNDNSSLQAYISMMEKINVELDNMQQDAAFKGQEATLDSLEEYFQDKADLMYSLVIFKQSSEYERLNSKAYNKLNGKANEQPPQVSSGETTPIAKQDPGIKSSGIKSSTTKQTDSKKEKKKDEGFLRNLFSGKNDKSGKGNEEPVIVALKDTVNISAKDQSVTIDLAQTPTVDVEDVRGILREISQEQKRYNTQLTLKELEILASDKLIIKKIDEIISRLSFQEQAEMSAQLTNAQNTARQSSQIMLWIAGVALTAGLGFMTVIIMDIIRSNRYKQQLIEARNRAEYLAKAKEEFLANMSHEIRTPLNAIIGFSEQIEHTPLQPEQKKFIKAVSNAGTHLLNTVNDILDLSKIEAGKLAVDQHALQVKDILEEVVAILDVKAKEKNLALSLALGEDTDVWVMGDSFRIKQLLYNIAGNAIKFTEHGFVEISCSSKKGRKSIEYAISIRDTGIGIAADKLDSIFDIFEQAESTITKKYGGTGLGLSISKRLANIMDGDISVKSTIGEGSEFIIHLPMRIATNEEAAQVTQDRRSFADLHGLEILLVDDEPYNLMLAEVILHKFGANSHTAANGREALELIDLRNFDIVLADLHMPEVDGYMLANRIRERYLQVPLIALTANVMQNDIERIQKSGFNDILLKPYKEHELLHMIAKYAPVVFGESTQEITVDEAFTEAANPLYHLEEVQKFADNDEEVVTAIIETFLNSNKENLSLLKQAVANQQTENIRNIAHKMLPGFNHFGVHSLVPVLKELEHLQEPWNGQVTEQMQTVQTVASELFASLESEVKNRKHQ